MTKLRISVVFVATLIVIAGENISVDAQTTKQTVPAATSKSATIRVSIAVPIERIPLGQKPWVYLTVKNLGSERSPIHASNFMLRDPRVNRQLHISSVR
jgi:hypothetical protein